MTYGKPYRTATHDRAVAALQALLKEEGPAQVYRACGDAVAYLQNIQLVPAQSSQPVIVSKSSVSEKRDAVSGGRYY